MNEARHVPVLLKEVLEVLDASRCAGRPSLWLDGTLGLGGHAKALLEQAGGQAYLVGTDRDGEALALAGQALHGFGTRVHLVHKSFDAFVDEDLVGLPFGSKAGPGFDGILLDLGVSSLQLDSPGRGFSFQREGPLDMRMDSRDGAGPGAADWLAGTDLVELTRVLFEYGEERQARRLARAVLEARDSGGLRTTLDLAHVAEKVLGRPPGSKTHPATRLFQALRLAVNGELQALENGLPHLERLLAPGGRMAVISFHSLEDRLVKDRFRRESKDCVCPPGLPECRCGHRATLKLLTPRALQAGDEETSGNPRARSAKLRAVARL